MKYRKVLIKIVISDIEKKKKKKKIARTAVLNFVTKMQNPCKSPLADLVLPNAKILYKIIFTEFTLFVILENFVH